MFSLFEVRPAGLHDLLERERLAQVPGQLQLPGHEGRGGLQLPVEHLRQGRALLSTIITGANIPVPIGSVL